MNHTPGPWKVTYRENGAVMSISEVDRDDVPGAVGRIVRRNGIGMPGCPIGKANARLIAAAPDMLEVLQHLYDYGYVTSQDHGMVRNVIAKATGCDIPESTSQEDTK